MNSLNLEPLALENITISVADDQEGVILNFSGMIDMRDPGEEVLPFFLKIHDAVLQKGLKIVKIDFRDLQFMNSSGIKAVITWIAKSKFVPEDERYTIIFIQNPAIAWQENSLCVIRDIFSDVVQLITG